MHVLGLKDGGKSLLLSLLFLLQLWQGTRQRKTDEKWFIKFSTAGLTAVNSRLLRTSRLGTFLRVLIFIDDACGTGSTVMEHNERK